MTRQFFSNDGEAVAAENDGTRPAAGQTYMVHGEACTDSDGMVTLSVRGIR